MFIHEFVRTWIVQHMEDPVERDRRWKEYLLYQKHLAERL